VSLETKDSLPLQQPLVSVITPVYNGEKYLAECIDSVRSQIYRHWEYIIVNNCSTDRTLDIAESYASRDPRIRIHNNAEFVGVIRNHNIGFQLISPESKYSKVLQADDWLFPDCLKRMVEVAEAHPSVGIVGAYRLDGTKVNLDGLPYPSTVVPGREICRSSLLGKLYVFGSPTSLLVRSDLIRKRKEYFDESSFSIHVDAAACYETLREADFGFVHQVLTYTRRHGGTETSTSRMLNSYLASEILRLKTYGPVFLDRAEYQNSLDQALARYHRFLARNLWENRDPQFWDYHTNAMKTLGVPLNRRRLVRMALSEARDLSRRLGRTLRRAFHLVRKRSVI
jgi:glycosyltransferase involved in cell wall biosynthesis